MAVAVELPGTMEAAVQFVEATPPSRIVEDTIARLEAGAAPSELLAAGALAVSRSTELPADHHGGPVHPISGVHAIHHTGSWLTGDWSKMPVVHSVALANRHVHSPEMGPAIMPSLPADSPDGSREEQLNAFRHAIRTCEPVLAQRIFLGLYETHRPGEILDAMLETALRRNGMDDHYFLYTVHAVRALQCIGWQWAPVVLRPVVRYLSTNMRAVVDVDSGFTSDYVEGNLAAYKEFWRLEALIDEHRLLECVTRLESGDDEDTAVAALGERIADGRPFAEIPGIVAQALAGGLSLAGVGEAMSFGAALLHLRTDYGNPFDVHLHTGINTRRYLLDVPEVSLRNKLLGLLGWACGPEVRLCESRVSWPPRFDTEAAGQLDQRGLLEAIERAITERTPADPAVSVEALYCGEEVKETLALAQAYADADYDPGALFQLLGELVCRDDASEMHAFKHLQAAREEYETSREPCRRAHLVSAAKMAWCTFGFGQDVYRQAQRHLAI